MTKRTRRLDNSRNLQTYFQIFDFMPNKIKKSNNYECLKMSTLNK
jgi:hypothetical protein